MMTFEERLNNAQNMQQFFSVFKQEIEQKGENFLTAIEKINKQALIQDSIGYAKSLQLMMVFLSMVQNLKDELYRQTLLKTAAYLSSNEDEINSLVQQVIKFNEDEENTAISSSLLLQYSSELLDLDKHSAMIDSITKEDFNFKNLLENEKQALLQEFDSINPFFSKAFESGSEVQNTPNHYYEKLMQKENDTAKNKSLSS